MVNTESILLFEQSSSMYNKEKLESLLDQRDLHQQSFLQTHLICWNNIFYLAEPNQSRWKKKEDNPFVTRVCTESCESTPYYPSRSQNNQSVVWKSSIQFKAEVDVSMDDTRSRWTTYNNLSPWFDNWEELGLGSKWMANSWFQIWAIGPNHIINIDETALCLDGNDIWRGGRPSAEFVGMWLLYSYKRTSKSSIRVTVNTGSSAAGVEKLFHHISSFQQKQKPVLVKWVWKL